MAKPVAVARPDRPLIAAKYALPPERPGAVGRSSLVERLVANAATRLTVVVAPAGWGKTTLLSQWAQAATETRRIAWLSLDPADDEPTRFWTYALTALAQHDVGGRALRTLDAPGVEPVMVALPLLLNELETSDARYVLVLDDYHVIADPRIHEELEFLLTYLPPALRLVLVGRADPPLPLPRLRARGELTEIRMSDLAFSAAETAQLITSLTATELDASALGSLHVRTEGWAAGIQLAALTISGRSTPAAAVEAISGADRHLLDFFSSEVISQLTQSQRDLLVQTCMLERLSGPLCDAVLEQSGSAEILAGLDRANLFVSPLDSRAEWYRCHRLFRDALHHELRADTASLVRVRAANWFAAQGLLEDAIELRIEAGDPVEAKRMLRDAAPFFLQHGAGRILRLGRRLGLAAAASDPGLCASLGWAAASAGAFDQMQPWLDAAEAAVSRDADPPPGWHSLRGAVASLRSVQLLATAQLVPESSNTTAGSGVDLLRLAARGVAAETNPNQPGYVLSRHILGTSYLASGRPKDAIPALTEAWHRARQPDFAPIINLQAACSLALALFQVGRHLEARRVCDKSEAEIRAVEQAWGDAAALGIARIVLVQARLALIDNTYADAIRLARRAVTLSKIWGLPSQIVMALTTLAEGQLAVGERTDAQAAVVEARELVIAEPIWPFVVEDLDDVETRVGREAVRVARRPGILLDDLTDRELSILRMLTGTASQREIGAALFLSINTVKSYTKSLYRKLEVSSRQDAVERARALNLI